MNCNVLVYIQHFSKMDIAILALKEGINMYQIDLDKKMLTKIDSTALKNENMLDTADWSPGYYIIIN